MFNENDGNHVKRKVRKDLKNVIDFEKGFFDKQKFKFVFSNVFFLNKYFCLNKEPLAKSII